MEVNPSLPVKVDFSPLKSYFNRLDQKLRHPMLHSINGDIPEEFQPLLARKQSVSEKCNLVLATFFDASIDKKPHVVANNWEEVAVLNLVFHWFSSEAKKINKDLDELLSHREWQNSLNIGGILISKEAGKNLRNDRDSKGTTKEDDCRKATTLDKVLKRAYTLDDRIAPYLVDLFWVIKRYGQGIGKIIEFRHIGERALHDGDKTRFFVKVVELLEVAEKNLERVGKYWQIHGLEDNERNPEVVESAGKLLGQLMIIAYQLNEFSGWHSQQELQPDDVMTLERHMEGLEAEIERIEAAVDELIMKRDGLFIEVLVAICHAIHPNS